MSELGIDKDADKDGGDLGSESKNYFFLVLDSKSMKSTVRCIIKVTPKRRFPSELYAPQNEGRVSGSFILCFILGWAFVHCL